MSKSKIEYCHYTWNPVVGCLRGCPYCYAKRLNDRFHFVKDFSKPEFFPKKLKNLPKKPSIIFVGSMCDLWNDNIPHEWKHEVLKECWKHPQHIFLFLTKNLKGYKGFYFPNNAWLGFTYDGSQEYEAYAEAFIRTICQTTSNIWLSIEPLQRNFDRAILNINWDWVVVGMTPENCHAQRDVNKIVEVCLDRKFSLFLKPNLHYPLKIQQCPPEFDKVLSKNPIKKGC